MLDETQLREAIIRPALEKIKLYSKDAEELLVATLAHESKGGTYLVQINGPALGIYQMEPFTHDDVWRTFLSKDAQLAYYILSGCRYLQKPDANEMINNLFYATMMARAMYRRVKEPLPNYTDIEGIAKYWKKHYNTEKGSGTIQEFIESYNKYTGNTAGLEKKRVLKKGV